MRLSLSYFPKIIFRCSLTGSISEGHTSDKDNMDEDEVRMEDDSIEDGVEEQSEEQKEVRGDDLD
jgi:hypothetical protein